MKLSYEQTNYECEKLLRTNSSWDAYGEYLDLLEVFGWTRQDFDNEMLKRVMNDSMYGEARCSN
jgi:hypothetical protein